MGKMPSEAQIDSLFSLSYKNTEEEPPVYDPPQYMGNLLFIIYIIIILVNLILLFLLPKLLLFRTLFLSNKKRKFYLELINKKIKYILGPEEAQLRNLEEKNNLYVYLNDVNIKYLRKNLSNELGFSIPFNRTDFWITVENVIDDLIFYEILNQNYFKRYNLKL